MPQDAFFPQAEYDARLRNVQQDIAEQGLDALLVSIPENIYYLAGVNHWGFFAYHMLVVKPEGEMIMIARAMEQVTMDLQLTNARFIGYGDLDDPAEVTLKLLEAEGLHEGHLGMEATSLYLQWGTANKIQQGLPGVRWVDASDLVFHHRATLSPLEVEYAREAAGVSDAMIQAGIDTAGPGVREKEVAAEVHRAMILAGGEYPAFGPFIRSTPTLGIEHGTWSDRLLADGDALFIELAGCVARYHAPMGRLVFIGGAPPGTAAMQDICLQAFAAVTDTIRPGVTADAVYQAWQGRVDAAGLSHYRRHHCGYMVGAAFPPSWSWGGAPIGLRHDSDFTLRAGMIFHLMSWLMHTGRDGDYFVSDTALVTEHGCEVLTSVPQHLHEV